MINGLFDEGTDKEGTYSVFFSYIIVVMVLSLFKNMERYFVDWEYRITIDKNRVHIMNYLEIVDFSDTRIVVRYDGGKSVLMGTNLVVSKMQDDEILIEGKICSVEV